MAAGLTRTGADREIVRPPVSGVYLRCEECGDLLRYLIRFRGHALCKSCVAVCATGRGGR
jgi:hypothetical protein